LQHTPNFCEFIQWATNASEFTNWKYLSPHQLQEKKKGSLSNCPYHYAAMNYKAAAKFSMAIPCTNVPVHCPLCPTSVSGQTQTIWKYNAVYHLIHEHSIGDTSPFQDNFWFRFLSPKRKKGLWVSRNRPQQDGEGRTIFLTVMALRLIYKALKLTKGTDQTQYPQLILSPDKYDGKRHKLGYTQE
jgi:hypothetical protein